MHSKSVIDYRIAGVNLTPPQKKKLCLKCFILEICKITGY